MTTNVQDPPRIACLDQLRGYAIFGMVLVNASEVFLAPVKPNMEGSRFQRVFERCVDQLSHHDTVFTYADTIAPLFMFVVGMGMRASWLRQSERLGATAARKSLAKRYAMLVLIALAIYGGWSWDAFMDIGLSGLLAVMLIDKKSGVRVLAACAFVAAFQCLHTFTPYGTWSVHGSFNLEDPNYRPLIARLVPMNGAFFAERLNGGPLGPMSWVMMLLFGSYAYDLLASRNERKFIGACVGWGLALCAAAYAFRVEWPGVKEAWPFSALYMTAPFPLWSTGLCFLHLPLFYLLSDKLHLRVPTFASAGMNPLLLYIGQHLSLDVIEDFSPERLTLTQGLFRYAILWGIFAGVAYYLHRKKVYVKV